MHHIFGAKVPKYRDENNPAPGSYAVCSWLLARCPDRVLVGLERVSNPNYRALRPLVITVSGSYDLRNIPAEVFPVARAIRRKPVIRVGFRQIAVCAKPGLQSVAPVHELHPLCDQLHSKLKSGRRSGLSAVAKCGLPVVEADPERSPDVRAAYSWWRFHRVAENPGLQ